MEMEEEKQKKVLIVDDDFNLRSVLADKFKNSGFYVEVASNGQEGLNLALEIHPDVILLDILMPIMNGWSMLDELRKDEWGKKAKVIMLTVVEDAEAIARAVQDGSFAYVVKTSHSIDDIVAKVKEMSDAG